MIVNKRNNTLPIIIKSKKKRFINYQFIEKTILIILYGKIGIVVIVVLLKELLENY